MSLLKRVFFGRILPWTLVVIAAAAAITFAVLWSQERSEDERRAEIERTASDFVDALTNFSSTTIERDIDEIRSFAAGRFEEEVDRLFSDATVQAIEEAEATSESEIEAIFVQRLENDRASVFAVASVTIENAQTEEPRTDVVRLEIGLLETAAGWKVESVELFQSPGAPDLAPGLG